MIEKESGDDSTLEMKKKKKKKKTKDEKCLIWNWQRDKVGVGALHLPDKKEREWGPIALKEWKKKGKK